MLVIGSAALKFHNVDIGREPVDIDIISREDELTYFIEEFKDKIVSVKDSKQGKLILMQGVGIIEVEITKNDNSAYRLYSDFAIRMLGTSGNLRNTNYSVIYAWPEICLAIKWAHKYKKNSPHFKKTMDDILLLQSKGYSIPEYLNDWVKLREKETYNYSHPILNTTKKDFFSADNVPYVYEHDDIHAAIAYLDKPAYEYIKSDSKEVMPSKEMFMQQSEQIKLLTVLEESMTLALERMLIPNEFKPDPKRAFMIALEKVCTSISSGWWRKFAWDNYYKVLEMYDESYVNKFHEAKEKGLIRPYQG